MDKESLNIRQVANLYDIKEILLSCASNQNDKLITTIDSVIETKLKKLEMFKGSKL